MGPSLQAVICLKLLLFIIQGDPLQALRQTTEIFSGMLAHSIKQTLCWEMAQSVFFMEEGLIFIQRNENLNN